MFSSRSDCSTIRSRSFRDSFPFLSKALRKVDRRIAAAGWLITASPASFSLALAPISSLCSGIVLSPAVVSRRAIDGHRPHQPGKRGGADVVRTHLSALGVAMAANRQTQRCTSSDKWAKRQSYILTCVSSRSFPRSPSWVLAWRPACRRASFRHRLNRHREARG